MKNTVGKLLILTSIFWLLIPDVSFSNEPQGPQEYVHRLNLELPKAPVKRESNEDDTIIVSYLEEVKPDEIEEEDICFLKVDKKFIRCTIPFGALQQ